MKTLMGIGAVIVIMILVIMVLVSNQMEATPEPSPIVLEEVLTCADGTVIQTAYLENENLIVTISDVPYELNHAISASGARYTNKDESFVFWNKGDVSTVYVDDEVVYENCRVPGSENDDEGAVTEDVSDRIVLSTPVAEGVIESPLTIEGEARGTWYFEATFPIILTNWDGLIIAEGYATADGDWMTEDFVPFTAELEFVSPYSEGDPDFMKRGSLILQRANPSDLPENDAALEITVWFAE